MEDLLVRDAEDRQQPDDPSKLPQHPAGQGPDREPREVGTRDEYVNHCTVATVQEVFHFTVKISSLLAHTI